MKSVEAKRDDLLEKLKTNREAHQARYGQVVLAWRNRVIDVLSEHLAAARTGGEPEAIYVSLPPPVSYVQDYDTAIEMLNWEEREVVEIDEKTFRRFVMDQWEWKTSFETTASTYRA